MASVSRRDRGRFLARVTSLDHPGRSSCTAGVLAQGQPMSVVQSDWEYLEAIRRERGWLLQQIKDSQTTIARSQELIQRLDEINLRERRRSQDELQDLWARLLAQPPHLP